MRRLYVLILLFYSVRICLAQSPPVDSLKNAFVRTEPSQYKAFFDVLDEHLKNLSLEQALAVIEHFRSLPTSEQSPNLDYFLTNSLFHIYQLHKQYATADNLLQKNLTYAQAQKLPLEQAHTLRELGYLYNELHKYPEASRYMEQASELYQQLGWQRRASLMLYAMGDACYKYNERKGCEEYFLRALVMGVDSMPLRTRISSYNTLGLIKRSQRKYESAISYFQKTLDIAIAVQDSAWINIAKGNIGICFVSLGKPDEALAYLEYDLKTSLQSSDWSTAASDCYAIGNAYRLKNNLTQALRYYLHAAEIAKKDNDLPVLGDIYKNLSQTYQQAKQLEKSLTYLQLHVQVSDSLAQQHKEIAIIKAQSSFDLQKKELELKNLFDQEHRREQIMVFVFVASGLLVLALLLTLQVYQKIKVNRLLSGQKQELEEKNEQLEIQRLEIESQNEELTQNQEEIATQRDLLSVQNRELHRVQEIITLQNEEIQMKNLQLEQQVQARTQKLVEYTRQLQEFAFITAHNLRAPVAQILGLGQLLHMPDNRPDEEKLYIEKMITSTQQLDQIVKEMHDVLANQTPEDL